MITKDDSDWYVSPDAMVWAQKFCEQQRRRSQPGDLTLAGADPTDEGFMVSWFANAMAAGERDAIRRYEKRRPNAPKPSTT